MRIPRLPGPLIFSLLFLVVGTAQAKASSQESNTSPQRSHGPIYLRENSHPAGTASMKPALSRQAHSPRPAVSTTFRNSGFFAATQIPTTGAPIAVVAGDFNGDGKNDIGNITFNADGTFSISILISNGNGTFQAAVSTSVSFGYSDAICAADLNSDGKADVVLVHRSGSVDVFLGNGDGTFTGPVTYNDGLTTFSSASITDVNGDGKPDIVVADGIGGRPFVGYSVVTFLGNGDGTFHVPTSASVPGSFSTAVFADVNGDGKLDLVSNTQFFLANPAGGYFPPVALSSSSTNASCTWANGIVAVADVNSDGRPDIVTADCSDNTVTVYLNNGSGTFLPGTSFWAGIFPQAVFIADVNGDGKLDILSANADSGDVTVLLGDGTGNYQTPQLGFAFGGNLWATPILADFNGHGILDIVVPEYVPSYEFNLVYVQGLGNGRFVAAHDFYFSPQATGGPNYGVGIASADFNGDGIPDFVLGNAGNANTPVTVFLANSNGTLKPGVDYGTGGTLNFVATGDFNGDGKQDIVASDASGGNVYLFLGNGDGTFQSPQTVTAAQSQAEGLVVGDFNNDGKPDIAVVGDPSSLYILINNGSGFNSPLVYSMTGAGWELTSADINHDGNLDLLVTQGQSTVSVFLGKGDGTFQAASDFDLGSSNPVGIAVGDLNGDGNPDLAATVDDPNNGMGVVVALGNGDGTFQTPILYSTSISAMAALGSYPGEVKMSDLNQDGKLDLIYTNSQFGTVGVLYGIGDGTFSSPVEFPVGGYPYSLVLANVNGGSALDTVTGDNGFSGVTLLLNSQGAKTTLSSSQNPSTSGQSVTFTASVAGIPGLNQTPTGNIAFKDGSIILNTVALNNGRAALTVSSLSVGSHVLSAAYSGDTSHFKSAASVLQVVNPAVGATPRFALSANPSSATIYAGHSVNFSVAVTPINGFTGTVRFTCGSLPAGLSCQFSPQSVTITSSQLASVQLTVTAASLALSSTSPVRQIPGHGLPLWASFTGGVVGFVMLEGLSQRNRRRLLALVATAIIFAAMISLVSCIGTPATSGVSANPQSVQIIVTGTAANGAALSQQVKISVTIR